MSLPRQGVTSCDPIRLKLASQIVLAVMDLLAVFPVASPLGVSVACRSLMQ